MEWNIVHLIYKLRKGRKLFRFKINIKEKLQQHIMVLGTPGNQTLAVPTWDFCPQSPGSDILTGN